MKAGRSAFPSRSARVAATRVACVLAVAVVLLMQGSVTSGQAPEPDGRAAGGAGAVLVPAVDDVSPPRSYRDEAFGDLEGSPTAEKPQSKLWFHDGAWWALMVGPEDPAVRIHELMPDHTWRPTPTVVDPDPSSVGDALPVGETLFVAGRSADLVLDLMRLTYDPVTRSYEVDAGFPVPISSAGSADVTIAQDSLGQMWAAWTTASKVVVSHSDQDGRNWSPPFSPVPQADGLSSGEISAVLAFDQSIGLLWSDQADGAFRFAVHRDAATETEWLEEVAFEGPGMADDHINVAVVDGEPSDTIVAAVKTSQGDAGEPPDSPLVLVLVRSPDGVWDDHVAGTVADQMTRPVILVDAVDARLHLFTQSPVGGGAVYLKSSDLADIDFPAGRGEPFVFTGDSARLADPTTTGQPVDASTGMVILVSDPVSRRYAHGEQPLPSPEGGLPGLVDEDPPASPDNLEASLLPRGVQLTWTAAADGSRWAPAVSEPPVAGYLVFRDGERLGTTTRPSFTDRSPAAAHGQDYWVQSIDLAGNRSQSSAVVTSVQEAGSGEPGTASPWMVAAAVGSIAVALLGTWWLSRCWQRAAVPAPTRVVRWSRSGPVDGPGREG